MNPANPRLHFCLLLLALLSLASCGGNGSSRVPKNVSDQNFIAIREEFRAGNHDSTLKLIRESGDMVETNLAPEVVRMKIDTLKSVADALNRQTPKSNVKSWQKAQLAKYGNEDIRLVDGKFRYMGRDYLRLLELRKTSDAKLMLEYLRLNSDLNGSAALSEDLTADFQRKTDWAEKFLKNADIPPEARSEVILFLMNAYLRLSGLAGGTATNARRIYDSRLRDLADMVISGVKDRSEVLKAWFLKIYLYTKEGKLGKVRESADRIAKEFGADKLASIPLYWKANEAYLKNEAGKALGLYQKALAKASALGTDDLRRHYVDYIEDADHFRQDIVKRINVIRSEMDYQRSLATRKFAVVTGDNVRLRQTMKAETSKNIITSLGTGEKVIYLRKSDSRETIDGYTDYWYYVRLRSGNEGWIFGKYLLIF